jgi:hypothetical protein
MKHRLLLGAAIALAAHGQSTSSLLTVDYQTRLARRSQLRHARRAQRRHSRGQRPHGSLVWTTPSALHFQINRADVFAENSYTASFPRADSDYASGCGYVDINLVQSGDAVFVGAAFHQALSARGSSVTARVLAWPQRDVMAVEIDDERAQPEPINIDLCMLRYMISVVTGKNWELVQQHAVMVKTAEQSALSRLDIRNGRITLTQEFREGDFYDSSAVAIGILGRASRARYENESTAQLSVAPGKGRSTVLISSAASLDSKQDASGPRDGRTRCRRAAQLQRTGDEHPIVVARFLGQGFRASALGGRSGRFSRRQLHLFPLHHGRQFPRRLSAALRRHALVHQWRYAPLGRNTGGPTRTRTTAICCPPIVWN